MMNSCWRPNPAVLLAAPFALGLVGCTLEPKEELGLRLFNDTGLSAGHNQSCATCHSRDTGGTGEDSAINAHGAVYEGSVPGRFGNRKPPASTYATLAPVLAFDSTQGFVGGNFWDGRATGWRLGTPAADQAQGPFLNPLEQAVPSAADLVSRVCGGSYASLFRTVWGAGACGNIEQAYADIALSIAAFEDSQEVNPFRSKFDAVQAGEAKLSAKEARGLALFKDQARCAKCHTLGDSARNSLFTDFTFDNLGIPRNPENPFYSMDTVLVDEQPVNSAGRDWVDPGLGGFLEQLAQEDAWRSQPFVTASVLAISQETLLSLAESNYGKHRVPTLRNVDRRPAPSFIKAYGHNGYFKSLYGIVHFYNTRDILPPCVGPQTEAEALANNCWPEPEVAENINRTDMGDLGLNPGEERALVAFLETLSDGWDDAKGGYGSGQRQ